MCYDHITKMCIPPYKTRGGNLSGDEKQPYGIQQPPHWQLIASYKVCSGYFSGNKEWPLHDTQEK